MYAIIETGGKQYKVSSGDTIKVDKMAEEAGVAVTLDKVLAVVRDEKDKKNKIGAPYVKGAEVKAEVIGAVKGEKVIVHKQRPRKVYRKTNGHRQQYTALKINEIVIGGKDGA
ncbi:MAG: 50S ribosomal protein L21 [Thermodesulfovibrionales bacterium]